jgi:hypothetical protein
MNIHTTYIFSTSGGVGPLTDGTYTKLAVLIAEKRNHSYSTTIRWIRCRLTFALIRSYTRLAVLIAEKRNHSYSTTIRWIRCRLTFALIRSYTRLAVLIAEKRNHSYSTTIRWIRCRLTFALIRSAILCLRGHRSRQGRPDRSDQWHATDLDMIVATAQSHI